jgi:hypothetical protein
VKKTDGWEENLQAWGGENFGENKRKNPNLNPLTLSRPPFPKKKT